jgi:hypothetical protein
MLHRTSTRLQFTWTDCGYIYKAVTMETEFGELQSWYQLSVICYRTFRGFQPPLKTGS